MNTETASLYEALGGEESMDLVVDLFYQRILSDKRISHYFEDMDIAKQRQHQKAFISQLLGGPQHYSGRSMREAHAHLKLNEADFNAVAGHLVATLEQLRIPQLSIDTVINVIAGFEHDIVTNTQPADGR